MPDQSKTNHDDFVKSPDASVGFILRYCDAPQVRLNPQDLPAVPADLYTKPSDSMVPATFDEDINREFIEEVALLNRIQV